MEICLDNPLSIPILLLDVRLLWTFLGQTPGGTQTHVPPVLVTNEQQTKKVMHICICIYATVSTQA